MARRGSASPEVLRAVLDLFVERGFDQFSIADVAERTDAASHLDEGDRIELVIAAVDRAVPMLSPCPDLGSLRADLEAIARWQVEMMQAHRPVIQQSLEAALISAEYAEAAREISQRRLERYRPILEHAIARREIPATTELVALELVFAPLWTRFFEDRAIDGSAIDSVVEGALHGVSHLLI